MTSTGKMVACDNCGHAAGPRFCPHCGQEVRSRRGPLVEAGREVLADLLSLDSRLLRSLEALARPGKLTELYLAGKRAPFLRPTRLYLLASLVVFSTVLSLATPDVSSNLDILIGGELISPGIPAAEQEAIDPGQDAAPNVGGSIQLLKNDTWLDRWLFDLNRTQIDQFKALPRQELLEVLFLGLRQMLPLTLILFVPFLALALKLLYIRKRGARHLYLDHLVFSLHYQAALFFALTASWLVSQPLGLGMIGSVLAYVLTGASMLFFYLPLALARAYRQARRWTFVKTFVLLFMYLQILSLAVTLSLLVAIRNA
jgi:hypothetical protein